MCSLLCHSRGDVGPKFARKVLDERRQSRGNASRDNESRHGSDSFDEPLWVEG
jgi:transposase